MRRHVNPGSAAKFFRRALVSNAGCRVVLLLLAISGGMALDASGWSAGILDPSADQFSSMKFDAYGNAHVSYVGSTNELRYGFWDHNLKKWFTTAVDKTGGFCSLVLDSHQRPHISYLTYGGGLTYARWDGESWQKQKIPVPSRTIEFYTSIALDQNDYPIISFYEVDSPEGERLARLRTVMWNGKYWGLTTVDGTQGSGKFNSIAVDSKGHPHIAYTDVNYENASMRYAYWNGESWKTEVLEGVGSSRPSPSGEPPNKLCRSVSMLLDKDDNPHITYTDVSHLLVKYATKKGGDWKIEAVDSLGKEGYPDRNGISLDDQGNPYISYYDAWAGLLKVAHRQGQKWAAEIVDRGSVGFQSSLQIDHGTIWVTYADQASGGLKFSRRPSGETDAPSPETGVAHEVGEKP